MVKIKLIAILLMVAGFFLLSFSVFQQFSVFGFSDGYILISHIDTGFENRQGTAPNIETDNWIINGDVTGGENNLIFETQSSDNPSLTTKMNMKNKKFKFDYEIGGNNDCMTNPVGSIRIISFTSPTIQQAPSSTTKGTIELIPSLFSDDVKIFYNGAYQKQVPIIEDNINYNIQILGGCSTPGGTEKIVIKNARYQLMFDCQMEPYEILGMETFGPGSINIQDLRYMPDKFCRAHPVILTDSIKGGSTTDDGNSIYEKLISGQEINIPGSQTWTIFYIFDNTNTNYGCTKGEIINLNDDQCKSAIGVQHICSEGSFDSNLGTCVVNPVVVTECERGFFDEVTQECVYVPPEYSICPSEAYTLVDGECILYLEGDTECIEGTFDADQNACIVTPDVECLGLWRDDQCITYAELEVDCEGTWKEGRCVKAADVKLTCEEGTLNPVTNKCIKYAEAETLEDVQEGDKNFNRYLMIIGGALLLIGIILFIKGKKRGKQR